MARFRRSRIGDRCRKGEHRLCMRYGCECWCAHTYRIGRPTYRVPTIMDFYYR